MFEIMLGRKRLKQSGIELDEVLQLANAQNISDD